MKQGSGLLMGSLVVVALVLGLGAPGGQATLAAGAIHYVDADATGANNGSSWEDAYTDLQPALEAATSGDQIWVAEGIYMPTVEHGGSGDRYKSFQMKNGVAIFGGFSGTESSLEERDWVTHVTILSGDLNGDDGPDFSNYTENSYHVFYHPMDMTALDESAILDGFTITGGNADGSVDHECGGGMLNSISSPTITNVVFMRNYANSGGGMYNTLGSDPVLIGATFFGNSASLGGGMTNYTGSSPSLIGVYFIGNTATDRGAGMYNYFFSSPYLTNVLFSANRADIDGGGMYNHDNSSPILTNVTFADNDAGRGAGMYNLSSNPIISNAIFWGGMEAQFNNISSTPEISYSDIQYGCPLGAVCDHVINLDPQFVRNPSPGSDGIWGTSDDDYGDLRLQLTSPAIDAGNNTLVPIGITTDLDGNPRFVDIPFVLNTGLGTSPVVDMGVYEVQLPVLLDTVLYVTPGGLGDCLSWTDACDLRSALQMAGPGSEIWVQTGVHKPTTGADRTASFTLASNVAIYGGFTGNETQREQRNWETNITVLSGDIGLAGEHSDDSFHIVSCSGLEATTILDGFTIRDSYANANAPDNSGGGMYNSHCNTTLSNLTFSHNAAYTGGGMYNNVSSPTLTNVVFVDNWANNGGGMYNDNNSPTLVDVTFSTNRASSAGGGMYNSSSNPTLSNVTFYENQAEAGGGMANATSNPYLVGVTFSNNTASGYGGGVYNVANSSPTLTNTLIIGNVSTYGGGIYNDASVPFLRNVQFSGNKAYDSGGGMENNNSSNAMLYNVTFAGNSAGFGGGLYNNGSYPTLYNGILWGNTPEQILNSEIPSFDVIYYSIIQDGCPAGSDCSHVIDLNPQFFRAPSPGSDGTWGTPDDDYGDLRLQLTSPGIDAGMNAVVPVDITTDLLGLPRFVDVFSIFDTGSGTSPIVDMGAYEAQAVVVYLPTLLK